MLGEFIVGNAISGKTRGHCAVSHHSALARKLSTALPDDLDGMPGPYDGAAGVDDLWFLPADDPDDRIAGLGQAPSDGPASLLNATGWAAAKAALAPALAALAFDLGRLTDRVAVEGQGAVHWLALAEAASLSWWTGDRIAADQLALWQSYRIGAADDDGAGPICTAWAARRLMAPVVQDRAGWGSDVAGIMAGQSRRRRQRNPDPRRGRSAGRRGRPVTRDPGLRAVSPVAQPR